MESETDDSATTTTYRLTCTDCSFETTVNGSVDEALEVAKSHRQEEGVVYLEHFVDFELVR